MRKQVKLTFEAGDANYVKPGEYFVEFSEDNTTIKSIQQRQDDLTMKSIVSTPLKVENNKAATATGASFTVSPSTGKDVMKKATITVPLEEGTATKSIASITSGDTLVLEPSEGKLGMSKVTITFTE